MESKEPTLPAVRSIAWLDLTLLNDNTIFFILPLSPDGGFNDKPMTVPSARGEISEVGSAKIKPAAGNRHLIGVVSLDTRNRLLNVRRHRQALNLSKIAWAERKIVIVELYIMSIRFEGCARSDAEQDAAGE
jgi:hypothetical protein